MHYFNFKLISSLLMALCLTSLLSIASASTVKPAPAPLQLKTSNTAAYLGLQVRPLPNELRAQLPEDVLVGQGVLLSGFMPDSPAKKQGLKRNDILLSYDKQEIMAPAQLVRLVKKDRPGRKVNFTLSRNGKIMTVPITLGSQQYPLTEDQLDYQYNMQVMGYDGIRIKQLEDDVFEAAIRYLAPDGVVRIRTFSGPYVFVMREISNAPDLSKIAKARLQNVIKERKDDEEGWFGKWIPFN